MVNRHRFGQIAFAVLSLVAASRCAVAQIPDPAAPHRTQVGRFFGFGVGAGYHSHCSAPRSLYPGLHQPCRCSSRHSAGCQPNIYLPLTIHPVDGHMGFASTVPTAGRPPSQWADHLTERWGGVEAELPSHPPQPNQPAIPPRWLPEPATLPEPAPTPSPASPPAAPAEAPSPPAEDPAAPAEASSPPAEDDELDLLSWRMRQQLHRQRLWQQWQAPQSAWAGDAVRIGRSTPATLGENPPRR